MTTTTATPALACDCHIHLYDAALPLAPTATFKPPHAPLASYQQVQAALGLERVVLVQPTGYGFDNRFMLDALAQLGNTARAIVIVPESVDDAELQRLHEAGVRGVRFMMIPGAGGPLPWSALERMAARIAELGWCIDLQLDGRDLPAHLALIERLPGKVVIDHTGKFLEPVALGFTLTPTLSRKRERKQSQPPLPRSSGERVGVRGQRVAQLNMVTGQVGT